MLPLPETTDWGVDTTCSCKFQCICLWFLSAARVLSRFVMISRASGRGIGVGMFSKPPTGVGVLAMPDARLDAMWRVEYVCQVPLNDGVLRLLRPGMAFGAIIDRRWVSDAVEVTCAVISAKAESFSDDEAVEFWPGIVEAMELPPSQ